MRFGIHFNTPTGSDTLVDDPPEPSPTPTPALNPPAPAPTGTPENRRLIQERQRARRALKSVFTSLGISPDHVKIEGGTGNIPIKFVSIIDGSDLTPKLQGAAAYIAGGGAPPKGANQNAVLVAQLQGENGSLKKKNTALIAFIKRTAVIEPLRAACIKHHAVDDDNGQYSDIINILAPLFVVDVGFDEDDESAEPEITVTPMNAGTPMMNATTNVLHTPDTLVDDLLTRKPKFRISTFRPGPGRNQNNSRVVVTQPGSDNSSPEAYTQKAVADFFGLRR